MCLVLWVRYLDIFRLGHDFIIEHSDIFCCFSAQLRSFGKLLFPISLVCAAYRGHEWFASQELCDCGIELGYSDAHALCCLGCSGILMLCELPVCKCGKVLMITKNVGEFPHVVLSEPDVDLIVLECFLEINSYLSRNFSELICRQTASLPFLKKRYCAYARQRLLIICSVSLAKSRDDLPAGI